MILMYDTSVLVAGIVQKHPRHETALAWLKKIDKKNVSVKLAAHSLAECYSVLTTLPTSPKLSPEIAERLIRESILSMGSVVSLTGPEYVQVLHRMTDLQLSGGIVYDALLLRTAEKAKADKLVTLNAKDFSRLWQPDGVNVVSAH